MYCFFSPVVYNRKNISCEQLLYFCRIWFFTFLYNQELERLEMKAALYEKLGGGDDLERAEEIVQGLVRRSADQWSYYVSLLDLIDRRNGRRLCSFVCVSLRTD